MFLWIIFCIALVSVICKLAIKLTTGWCRSQVCLKGKTAIVTGANTGKWWFETKYLKIALQSSLELHQHLADFDFRNFLLYSSLLRAASLQFLMLVCLPSFSTPSFHLKRHLTLFFYRLSSEIRRPLCTCWCCPPFQGPISRTTSASLHFALYTLLKLEIEE